MESGLKLAKSIRVLDWTLEPLTAPCYGQLTIQLSANFRVYVTLLLGKSVSFVKIFKLFQSSSFARFNAGQTTFHVYNSRELKTT